MTRNRREIHLDNASTSYPKPESVYQAMGAFARTCGASPGRGGYARALEADEVVARCRGLVARLLGAPDPLRIAFASGATEALNWALRGLLRRPGDHAVATSLEHNSVMRPLRALERSRGTEWSLVRCARDGTCDPAAVAAAIRRDTRVVCVVHASNVLGTLLPVADVVRAAHECGVPVLVDGSQSAGALSFSVADLGADLFAFTGHKALLGPPGTGGLYVRAGLELPTSKEGGTGTRSESLDHPDSMPERLECGTPNSWGLAGLAAGVEYVLERTPDRLRVREAALASRLAEGLRDVPGVEVHGPHEPERRVGIVSASVSGLPPAEVGRILGERYGIAVRAGLHCAPLAHETAGTLARGGTVRFAVGPFTTDDEIDAAVRAVGEIARAVRGAPPSHVTSEVTR